MFQYIEKLREKPDSTKKRVAFLGAFMVSGIIFVVWLSVLYPSWRNQERKEEAASKIEPSPLSGFAGNISQGFSSMRGEFSKIKESMSFFADFQSASSSVIEATSTQTLTE